MLRKYPYISAILISTILAIVVWIFVPKKYAACIRLSDEYKEMDLGIGLNKLQARINNARNLANTGINDMETYCKFLKTEEFAHALSQKVLPVRNVTYGEYLAEKDTTEAILSRIRYNYSRKRILLDIRFEDSDPYVASYMLDCIVRELQERVNVARRSIGESVFHELEKERAKAADKYHKAFEEYSRAVDSNVDATTQDVQLKIKDLEEASYSAFRYYQDVNKQYLRKKYLLQRMSVPFAVVTPNEVPQETTGSLWLYIFAFGFIAILVVWSAKRVRKIGARSLTLDFGNVFSPWTITLLIWLSVIVFIYLMGDSLYPLTTQFYVAISLWVALFCITSLTVCNLYVGTDANIENERGELHVNKYIFIGLVAISLVLTPLCVKKVMEIVAMFGTDNLMLNIRLYALKGEGFGPIDLCFIINKALFVVALWRYPKISIWWVLLITLLMLMNSFAVMDKGTIFYVLSAIMFVLYERGKVKLYHLAISMGVVIVLFFVLTIMRSGTDSSGEAALGDLSLLEFIGMYVLANPVAFGYLEQGVDTQVGSNTFFLLYYYLNSFGLGNFHIVDIEQEFVFVPIPTNLYTIMQPFFVDFGYSGVAFFAIVYGVIAGMAYGAYKQGGNIGKLIYTYMFYVLILQFGQEQIFLTPVPNLRIVVLFLLLSQDKVRLSYAKSHM